MTSGAKAFPVVPMDIIFKLKLETLHLSPIKF